MNLNHPSVTVRTRQILDDLDAVRENLLALSDDIWLSIDHNDQDALADGYEFKREYNANAAEFDAIATSLSELVQKYTKIRLDQAEESGTAHGEENQRLIRELNRNEPHTLDENFTYKRPHGFILDGRATTGITTWQRLYELVCRQLYSLDEKRFRELEHYPDLISNRGHHTVASTKTGQRKSLALADDLFVEANLSANSIRDVIQNMLAAFEIPADRMQIFLRQDRDADRNAPLEI